MRSLEPQPDRNDLPASWPRRHFAGVLAVLLPATLGLATLCAQGGGTDFARLHIEDALLPGHMAPDLVVGEWVQGAPLTRLDEGRTYVLAFWHLGCPSCEAALPVLDRLQERERGAQVTVIAVAMDDPSAAVQEHLQRRELLALSACCVPENQVAPLWVHPTGIRQVPLCHVVSADGRIAWYGNDVDQLSSVTRAVAAGTFDIESAATAARERIAAEESADGLLLRVGQARRAGDFDVALASLDRVIEIDPVRFGRHAAQRFQLTLVDARRPAAAYAYLRSHMRECLWSDPATLGSLARTILADPTVTERDIPLARELAERAVALDHGRNAVTLELLARAQKELGEDKAACETLAQAITHGNRWLRPRYEELLAAWRAEIAPTTPVVPGPAGDEGEDAEGAEEPSPVEPTPPNGNSGEKGRP